MKRLLFTLLTVALCLTGHAQESSADSTIQVKKASRFSVGGYGEANFTRNYFSDHVSRYSQPEEHKNDPSNGRFDIPHAVIYLGYDFGQGWKFGTEIEFEHGGTGIAYEKEDEEGGEWEQETEKGGEVELEQFWIEKSFASWANIRAGHIVVPVGLNNAHHEPLSYFTVYRPEGENTILPSTWHQTGVSFWGRAGDFRYEAQFLAGLNAGFAWKDFEFNMQWTAAWNVSRVISDVFRYPFLDRTTKDRGGLLKYHLDNTWNPENPGQDYEYPRATWTNGTTNNYQDCALYEKDAKYLRLKTLMIAYNMHFPFLKKLGINRAQLALSGYNLLTFTSYNGFDPEVGRVVGTEGNNLNMGVDYGNYPQTRSFTLGLKFGL